jgi:hypothetical protein
MAAITALKSYTAYSFGSPVPNLALPIPDQSQGEEGRELQNWVNKIVVRWQKQPPRGLRPLSPFQSELEADQAAANQVAIALLQSWCDEGDEQEQGETWAYLQQALDEDRLSNRTLFP